MACCVVPIDQFQPSSHPSQLLLMTALCSYQIRMHLLALTHEKNMHWLYLWIRLPSSIRSVAIVRWSLSEIANQYGLFILLGRVSQGQCFGLVCSGSPLKPISHRNTSCYPSFSTFNHSLGLQQIRTGYLDPFTHTQLHSAEAPGSWLQHGPALTIVVTWGAN